MKKLILPLFMVFILIASAQQAQKMRPQMESKVPDSVVARFFRVYPGTSPSWEIKEGHYIASFLNFGNSATASYDMRYNLVVTRTNVSVGNLPFPSTVYIQQNYPAAKLISLIREDDREGGKRYEATIVADGQSTSLVFLSNGEFFYKKK